MPSFNSFCEINYNAYIPGYGQEASLFVFWFSLDFICSLDDSGGKPSESCPMVSLKSTLKAPKEHYVELNFTLRTSYPTPCPPVFLTSTSLPKDSKTSLVFASSLTVHCEAQFLLKNLNNSGRSHLVGKVVILQPNGLRLQLLPKLSNQKIQHYLAIHLVWEVSRHFRSLSVGKISLKLSVYDDFLAWCNFTHGFYRHGGTETQKPTHWHQ